MSRFVSSGVIAAGHHHRRVQSHPGSSSAGEQGEGTSSGDNLFAGMTGGRRKAVQEDVASSDEKINIMVKEAVENTQVIDVHTHLFPPSHGRDLFLWGIDALLTYHYLVSELFMGGIASSNLSHESFFALSRKDQASIVWEHLFVRRAPTSEAAVGVLTVLNILGLEEEVKKKDLCAIRKWFAQWEGREDEYARLIFAQARVKYCVMTNIPYVEREALQWRSKSTRCSSSSSSSARPLPSSSGASRMSTTTSSPLFHAACRVDALLAGDWDGVVQTFLREGGYPRSIEGVKQYLRDWAKTMAPLEYFIASTPEKFSFPYDDDRHTKTMMKTPFSEEESERLLGSFDDEIWPWNDDNDGEVDDEDKREEEDEEERKGSGGIEGKTFSPHCLTRHERKRRLKAPGGTLLDRALLPVLRELDVALMIKAGACRGDAPSLCPCGGGDGIAGTCREYPRQLAKLARAFPRNRFCATVLARRDQHELCIVAQKFRNIHIYGCWWYCNTPSMINEITRQRLELLGVAFTAQHSDCRVLEQVRQKQRRRRREEERRTKRMRFFFFFFFS